MEHLLTLKEAQQKGMHLIPKIEYTERVKCSECGAIRPFTYLFGGKEPLCRACIQKILD